MTKIVLLIALLCQFSIQAKKNFVSYTEAFDVFEIVDQVSGWHSNSRPEYYKYFDKTFKLSHSDKMMLQDYRNIRNKYHKAYPNAVNSIFSEEMISNDSLSSTFIKEGTVDKAILKLRKKNKVKDEDLKTLVKIYRNFKPQVSKLVRESALLLDEAKRINKLLKKKKVINNIKKIDKFFDLPTSRIKTGRIKLVWWPATPHPVVDYRAGRVIIRLNPVKHANMINEDFILYTLVKSLIVSLSKNKKENLSKVFMDGCPKVKTKSLQMFEWYENPLIDAFSKYYLPRLSNKKTFNPYRVEGESFWRDVYSKYLFGLVQYSINRKGKFDREFVTISSKHCSQLLEL